MADEDVTISDVWSVHRADVGKIVRRATDALLAPDGKGICRADKRRMSKLVDGLSSYTDKVMLGAFSSGVFQPNAIMTDDSLWPTPSQWARDLSAWAERLRGYQDALERASNDTGKASCTEIAESVTGPLLLGWYLPGTPGIVNPAVQTVPDVVTPFMLGNQLIEYRDWQFERLRLLIKDIVSNAKKLAKKAVRGAKIGGVILGAGLIIAGGIVIAKKL